MTCCKRDVLQELKPELVSVLVDRLDVKMRQLDGTESERIHGDIIDVS